MKPYEAITSLPIILNMRIVTLYLAVSLTRDSTIVMAIVLESHCLEHCTVKTTFFWDVLTGCLLQCSPTRTRSRRTLGSRVVR